MWQEERKQLRENILVIMRALTEDVPESRLALGSFPGALDLFARIFDTPGLDSCYVELCKLLQGLVMEPENRMSVFQSPLFNHLKSLRKWQGSQIQQLAIRTVRRLETHSQKIRKIEKDKIKESRQKIAADPHRLLVPRSSSRS